MARDAFDPSARPRHAALGQLTPPIVAASEQRWHTYPPVAIADADRTAAFLRDPARWPDAAAQAGRFTALRGGGLLGQAFEIEVNARPAPRAPIFTRAYVTCTSVHEAAPDLERWADDLRADYRAGGGDGADPLPEDGSHEHARPDRTADRVVAVDALHARRGRSR